MTDTASRTPLSAAGADTGPFAALREQLLGAAAAFAADGTAGSGPDPVADILTGMVDDVDRALREDLEIFPVCHHSPASALAMARRLREKRPKVVYLELCEDLQPLLPELATCKLPVALQAYATEAGDFPASWAPLSVVAPVTEASAEYQAIAYALGTPGVEIVAVDRSADHVFQWLPKGDGGRPAAPRDAGDAADEEKGLHGDSVGVGMGDLRPGFAELEEHLLHHGKVRHWSEWWDQYVEQPLAGADYATYRQVMVLIGSLFRRLRPARGADHDRNEDRERHMWTRMREHLAATGTDPADCLYICGASHAASRVEQFGLASTAEPFAITPRTGTAWNYGLIPSSHSSIEAQFGLAQGAVSIAAAGWEKALRTHGVEPFRLAKGKGKGRSGAGRGRKAAHPPTAGAAAPVEDRLGGFLATPPQPLGLDEDELLGWCVDIVHLARRNGYAASTADAIAVYETSVLLASMRGRARPTPYDFEDAAVTCIEKDSVPGRRDVRRLCEILLGGDRIGTVGYTALPPLARDVLDRLEPLGFDLTARTVRRAILDLGTDPELLPCSDLLWVLHRLAPELASPILGARRLGERSVQESWDINLGREQRALVELGYEGVTAEQVLERRLRRAAWEPRATAATALVAVEEAVVLLGGGRLADDIGVRAVELLAAERTVDDAPKVLRQVRRLLAHYRATGTPMPRWCEEFVATGYAHYCTLLPTAFKDDAAGTRQIAAMLGFLFGMESFALSLGCDRTQLDLAVRQSHPERPDRTALLWAAHAHLGLVTRDELRERCDALLDNPLVVPAFPRWTTGFLHALEFTPALTPFVVELLSKAFGRLPDSVLLPWLPVLITTLREEAAELVPLLTREAGRVFPATLPGVDGWTPPWSARQAAPAEPAAPSAAVSGPVADLLAGHPGTTDALAALLGLDPAWPAPAGPPPGDSAARDLLARHPETAEALAHLLTA
ncbi:DUF5682 family protein [Streptomyces sp. RFCAC02]|uniref:DUF5682 family protein n=1 Tax=Streptomyces sp. RFCAC02 TaxID=2499143 RepID=UPI0010224075|nr:DUF5682 family protein [Streptomyces sp. RFCAC02]